MNEQAKTWAPVFTKDGNEFVIPNKHWLGETEQDAHEIGIGMICVECIMLGIKYAHRAVDIAGEFPHVEAVLPNRDGHFPLEVAVFAGPLFDEAARASEVAA